jgi:cytochrome c oxidase subunit 1
MILPAMGVINEVIPVMVRKPIFGYKAMAIAMFSIGFVGFAVWAHHMFTTGLSLTVRAPFMLATMVVAVPTGVKIFNWLATMWRGSISFKTPMLFAIGFSPIHDRSSPASPGVDLDYKLQETYWVVAHLHYVLFGGSVMGLFAGMYFFYPTMTGRMYDERLGQIHFVLTLVGMNLTFFTMHFIGLSGMLRRTFGHERRGTGGASVDNLLSTIGTLLLGPGNALFYNMIGAWQAPPGSVGVEPVRLLRAGGRTRRWWRGS